MLGWSACIRGEGEDCTILLTRERKNFVLLLSPDRRHAPLHLVSVKPAAEDSPHGFILFLRSRVSGARVTGISLLNQDRVVEIRFRRQGEEYLLVFELFGSSANLVIVDPSSIILAVYNPVPPSEEAARPLLPGLLYRAPEKPRNTGFSEERSRRQIRFWSFSQHGLRNTITNVSSSSGISQHSGPNFPLV